MNASIEPTRIDGSCLCGKVRLCVTAPLLSMSHCHCASCRHQHGNAFATYARAQAESVHLLAGAEQVRGFRSSSSVTREFCAECGTKLFYRADDYPQFTWIAAGVFDDDPGLASSYHLFTAEQAPWHAIGDDLPQFTGWPDKLSV